MRPASSSEIVVDNGGAISALSVTVDVSAHLQAATCKRASLVRDGGGEVTLHNRKGGSSSDDIQADVRGHRLQR